MRLSVSDRDEMETKVGTLAAYVAEYDIDRQEGEQGLLCTAQTSVAGSEVG